MKQCLAAASLLSADGKCALNAAHAPSVENKKTDSARSSSGAPDSASLECASSAASSRFRQAPRWRTLVNRRFHLSRSALWFFLLTDRLQFSNDRSCLSRHSFQRMSHEFGERDKTCRCFHAHFDFQREGKVDTQLGRDTTACAPTEAPATRARPSLHSKTKAAPGGLGVSPRRQEKGRSSGRSAWPAAIQRTKQMCVDGGGRLFGCVPQFPAAVSLKLDSRLC